MTEMLVPTGPMVTNPTGSADDRMSHVDRINGPENSPYVFPANPVLSFAAEGHPEGVKWPYRVTQTSLDALQRFVHPNTILWLEPQEVGLQHAFAPEHMAPESRAPKKAAPKPRAKAAPKP